MAWDSYYRLFYEDDDDENDPENNYTYTTPPNMSESGEVIDITETDTNVDDNDASNTTQPFTPGAASTPVQPQGASAGPYHGGEAHEMSQFPQEQRGQDTDPC